MTNELVSQLVILQKMHPPPIDRIESVKAEYFLQYDALLDAQDQSKFILADAKAIEIVIDSWKTLHATGTCLVHAVCVMGNHVHVILSGWSDQPIAKLGPLLARHKRFTNNMLKRAGYVPPAEGTSLWARGFFDRYIRPGGYEQVFDYVVDNPVKARLIGDGRKWKGLWLP